MMTFGGITMNAKIANSTGLNLNGGWFNDLYYRVLR